jgi:AAA domain-containing protein
MSATTVARRLTGDAVTARRIEGLLEGRSDDECEGILARTDEYRVASSLPFEGDSLVRVVQAARDYVTTTRDNGNPAGPAPAHPPNAKRALEQRGDRAAPWDAIVSAADFLGAPESETTFLEPRILAAGSLTQLSSPRGIGKTHFAHARAVVLAQQGRRVLIVDRDNSRRELKRRLRGWGAEGLPSLKVMGRDDAPPLTEYRAWASFPFADYDLVVIDSLDSATEGVGEQDSTRPSLALAPLLDIAHKANGPAILVLGNTIKSGSYSRGSGVIEDRADIVMEVRDATELRPSGTKDWWHELAPAGRDSWAKRAARRKKRDAYRLAFIPTKFRIGEEPDPFVFEIRLSTERWTCEEVTELLAEAAHDAREQTAQERADRIDRAATALRDEVSARASAGDPMRRRDDAESFLMKLDLRRGEARDLIDARSGKDWHFSGGARRGDPVVLLPLGLGVSKSGAAGIHGAENQRQYCIPESSSPAERTDTGQPETTSKGLAPALDNPGASLRPYVQADGGVTEAPPLPSMPFPEEAPEVTCPHCGGQALGWRSGIICTSCHRRFEADGVELGAQR